MKLFWEDHGVATLLGLALLAVAGVAGSHWREFLAMLQSGDARIAAAVIYGTFTVFGILLSTTLSLFVSWRKERAERSRVATALMAELYSQSDAVATIASFVNAPQRDGKRLFPDELGRLHPPSPTVYKALVERIVLFPPATVSSLVAFYGAVERAKELTDWVPPRAPPVSLRDGLATSGLAHAFGVMMTAAQMERQIVSAWRAAAHHAVASAKSLEPYARDIDRAGRQRFHDLKEELAGIALRGLSPRHTAEKSTPHASDDSTVGQTPPPSP
jgi:hypothetical protein